MKARLPAVLKALADPTRLSIYRRIAAAKGPLCVCELAGRFPVSQPTVSHHLRVLREAGLVTVERRGTWSWFEAVPGAPDVLRPLLGKGGGRWRNGRSRKSGKRCGRATPGAP
jgi:ArsR family transcriptional regulator